MLQRSRTPINGDECRFETIGHGNVVVRGGSRGGMLQRSRSPRNGDVWQI